jgi:GTP-binding protein
MDIDTIRNIAIIAHVDHGKTTLIDGMLEQAGMVAAHRDIDERAMDTHDLEQERGITILAKSTSIDWNDHTINIIDTPGHADFGGEVQRVLKMVDSVLLLVDAFEGPMPQTKYVLRKSLELGHQPVVAINKVDRGDARPHEVLDDIFDLFIDVGATDEQLDFPTLYTSAKEGYALRELDDAHGDLTPLFETIVDEVDPPEGDADAPLQMQVATLDYDDYVGRVAIGRVFNGDLEVGDDVVIVRRDGSHDEVRARKLFGFDGLERVERNRVEAGELCAVAGMEEILPGETICDLGEPQPMPMIDIDEPTVSMIFTVNDGPFTGLEGEFVTSRQIEDRLEQELEHNVALRVEEADRAESFVVSGRGELHLAVLLEEMRREGYELQVSRPEVIFREDDDGNKLEPIEEVVVEVDSEYAGNVIQSLEERRGELQYMGTTSDGAQRLEFYVPSRGLIGYQSDFLTDSRGTGVMHKNFHGYAPYRGEIEKHRGGAMVVKDEGVTTRYSLHKLEERGDLFVGPGEDVYGGQIIGVCNREHSLVVNPCKQKQLTNFRAAGSDDALDLSPAVEMTLERAIEFIGPDERVEITPESIRLRKVELQHNIRRASES